MFLSPTSWPITSAERPLEDYQFPVSLYWDWGSLQPQCVYKNTQGWREQQDYDGGPWHVLGECPSPGRPSRSSDVLLDSRASGSRPSVPLDVPF